MGDKDIPRILIVDDEPADLDDQFALEFADRARSSVLHPEDLEKEQIEAADLVLVDYRLDHWPQRERRTAIATRPRTGVAVASILREHIAVRADQRAAIALHTGRLNDIRGRLSVNTSAHVLARVNNLEWVFSKEEPDRFRQMLVLADAVRSLPEQWPLSNSVAGEVMKQLLAMEEERDENERCWEDVLQCRPPIRDVVEDRSAMGVLRWLLYDVLPYPTFLRDRHWVAARLKITPRQLDAVMDGSSDLARDLERMCYRGILGGFLGSRWWRGAVEDYVWDLLGECEDDERTVARRLSDRAGMQLGADSELNGVVELDATLTPTGRVLDVEDAIPIRPEYWPSFADPGWIAVGAARDDAELATMVSPFDRDRLRDGGRREE